jgi:lipopolysaccharide/colanic/teichoic acid biosynthesis glycosyltransferase
MSPRTVGLLERLVALILIIISAPLMLLIALAVKLDSPRAPVVYRQERVGQNRRCREDASSEFAGPQDRRETRGLGRIFPIYKFRSMIPDAEKNTGPVWASERDPRITPVGSVLRWLRLDELPQLFNILRGHMRLIGPRPERPHFVSGLCLEIPEYAQRLTVPPGITGLAQVERQYDASVEDVRTKVKYDLFYARNRSSLLDIKILLKTIDVMLRGRGVH